MNACQSVAAPSLMENYITRLRDPSPITCEEIKHLYMATITPKEVETTEVLFDQSHTLRLVIERLYKAVFFGDEILCDLSTTGACKVSDKLTKQVLFYSKMCFLPENFSVTDNGAIGREHLYYLLDRRNFAGVPPTFRVALTVSKIRSFNWFVENCNWWHGYSEEREHSLRKCVIHQFRTVNMDPSSPNLLIVRGSNSVFPIDGGYCLPYAISPKRNSFSVANHPPLVDQPFLDTPFTEEECRYIGNINLDEDENLISSHLKEDQMPMILKIFRVANLLLKKAAEQSQQKPAVCVTLHDLCNIRDLRSFHKLPKTSLFEHILLAADESDMISRIDGVFNEIIRIKTIIYKDDRTDLEQLTLNVFKTIDEKNLALRKIAAYYVLGGDISHKATFAKDESEFKSELLKIQ